MTSPPELQLLIAESRRVAHEARTTMSDFQRSAARMRAAMAEARPNLENPEVQRPPQPEQ